MKNYKLQFKDKKITIMGLGLLGGIGDIVFLAESGADLIVTDLKNKKDLKPSLDKLKKFKNIRYTLGAHDLKDFKNRDLIIKAPSTPLDSIYIKEAEKNKIPITMWAALFSQFAREAGSTVVGVTGTRGKTMTTELIVKILLSNKKKVITGGNLRGTSLLPHLPSLDQNTVIVLELDSWKLQGFGEAKISPNIAVFTTFMPDHMNYYKDDMKKYFDDKANIFKYQKEGDVLVVLPEVEKLLPKNLKSKVIIADQKNVSDWEFIVPGEHQRANLACAVEVAKQFNIPIEKIKQAVKKFKGVEGRLQLLKTYKGIKIYNDNNATTPEATIAGLIALGGKAANLKNIILIAGGADKGLNLDTLTKAIHSYCKVIILLQGTGTEKLETKGPIVNNIKDAVKAALTEAKRGDIILFSPAFASFGMFQNEYDRNDQFVKIIKGLK